MAYRKRYHRKRNSSASSRKSIYRKRPTASNQKYQILSLSKKVSSLNRQVNWNRVMSTQTLHFDLPITGTATNPFVGKSLNNIQGLSEIFLSTQTGGAKYHGLKFHLDFNIVPDTEIKLDCTMTVFVVSPRNNKVVEECYNATGQLTTLTNNTDYVCEDGMAFMNKKRWTIRKVWNRLQTRPIVSFEGGGTQTWEGSQVNIRKYFSCRNPLRLNNRTGTWNQILDNQMTAGQRMELIVFNNNTGTTSPMLTANIIMTAYTSE